VNEKIRLLAERTGLRFTMLTSNPMIPFVDGRQQDLEKFAELIVEETIHAIIKGGRGHLNPDLISNSAKEHFGMEK